MEKQIIETVKSLSPVVILSLFGGAVRLWNMKGKFSLQRYAAALMTAVFAGIVAHYLMEPMDIAPGYKTAGVAIAGLMSRDFLDIITDRFMKRINKELS